MGDVLDAYLIFPPSGKRPSLKVHINTTSDSILLKFLRPSPSVKLEGFLLGYGSNVSPNQYFPLPTEGKVTEAVVGKVFGDQTQREGWVIRGTNYKRCPKVKDEKHSFYILG